MENNENIALSEETAAPCGADTKRSFGNIVKHYADRYFIKALGAMAKGLFASLLIGTIIAQFARIPALSGILDPIVKVAQNGFVVGGCDRRGDCCRKLGAKALTLCAAVVAGAIGYTSGAGGAGPVGAYIAAVIGIEIGRLVEGKKKVDILLVPIAVLLTGGVVGVASRAPLGAFMKWLGYIIGKATYLNPIPMGIIVSVVMGIILTAPISSAAIASMIFVTANAAPDVKTGLMLAAVPQRSAAHARWSVLLFQASAKTAGAALFLRDSAHQCFRCRIYCVILQSLFRRRLQARSSDRSEQRCSRC